MEIKVSTEQARVPVTIIQVDGNIDSATYVAFKLEAEELIRGGARYILVDLSHSPLVSSAGLRVLLTLLKTLRALESETHPRGEQIKTGQFSGAKKSPHLKLFNLSQETQTAFKLSGFDMFMETFADRQTALASF